MIAWAYSETCVINPLWPWHDCIRIWRSCFGIVLNRLTASRSLWILSRGDTWHITDVTGLEAPPAASLATSPRYVLCFHSDQRANGICDYAPSVRLRNPVTQLSAGATDKRTGLQSTCSGVYSYPPLPLLLMLHFPWNLSRERHIPGLFRIS